MRDEGDVELATRDPRLKVQLVKTPDSRCRVLKVFDHRLLPNGSHGAALRASSTVLLFSYFFFRFLFLFSLVSSPFVSSSSSPFISSPSSSLTL